MIKELLPPLLLNYLTGFFYGWKGNYFTWAAAKKKCTGYNSDLIFSKVRNALLKVKNGEAVFERDSVLFDKVEYSFPMLSALSLAALKNNGKLNILDFGGSLGSSYFQNRNALKGLNEFHWCIVEQPHFVKEGQKNFQDDHLHFFYDIKSCTEKYRPGIFLLGSVLQYLEKPYDLLKEIVDLSPEYLLIDRTPVLAKGKDRITIQKVPKKIYEASYPCWFLSENDLLKHLSSHYELIFEGTSPERVNIAHGALKCFFLKRKK